MGEESLFSGTVFLSEDDTLGSDNGAHSGKAYCPY